MESAEGENMTFYPLDGRAVTRDELLEHIISVWKGDRNKARELVREFGLSWHEVAEYQRKGEK